MKLMVIGASSYVGARVYRDLKKDFEVVGTYFSHRLFDSLIKLDIRNKNNVDKVIKNEKPDVIIHIANYPSPKNAVNNREDFIKVNEIGTKNIVDIANVTGAKVIFISSQAANNPKDNLYGELKKKSEEIISKIKNGYLVIRPSLIVGSSPNTINPRLFNIILKCIMENKKEAFDISWKVQPTYIGHISGIIKKVIIDNLWNKTIPVFVNELVTQYQIANDILSHFGLSAISIDQKINIAPSKDNLTVFYSMNLPPNTYEEIIGVIVGEIKKYL